MQEHYEKIREWFKEEVDESLAWTEADLPPKRIREIVDHKTQNLIDYVEGKSNYKPW